mmetsp:Transcript_713/g.2883  ORF Transcript_713/g.2883 Transcript_713/m.2883 type:complete len:139 (-) Transcript_713:1304-1720(-)
MPSMALVAEEIVTAGAAERRRRIVKKLRAGEATIRALSNGLTPSTTRGTRLWASCWGWRTLARCKTSWRHKCRRAHACRHCRIAAEMPFSHPWAQEAPPRLPAQQSGEDPYVRGNDLSSSLQNSDGAQSSGSAVMAAA